MSDVRHQATWRLVADGRWEVEVDEDMPAHLPEHLRERFERDEEWDCSKLRCAASEVPSIMAEVVKVAVWRESKPMARYRFRADRVFDAQFLRDALEEAGVELLFWMPLPKVEGDVEVEFISDASIELLRGAMQSTLGGDRMRETLAVVDEGRRDRTLPQAPTAKGEA